MLIVVSQPQIFAQEASLINQLFEEGLTLLHLRKPEINEEYFKKLILEIDSKYYSKIVLHQHHTLAKEFGIRRLHLTEVNRNHLTETEIANLKKQITHLSTSIHYVEEYKSLSRYFDYTFLGPVFDSISKKEYKAIELKGELKNLEKKSIQLIAIGGITKTNYKEPLSWGFDGIAVLGSIWETKEPIKEFKELHKACNNCEITL